MICGNSCGNKSPIKTLTIVDNGNNELTGVVVDSQVIFTATDNDVREGIVYAGDCGVSTGTKDIPAYHTSEGKRLINAGSNFTIPLSTGDRYDYTALQVLICEYNTSLSDSLAVDRVGIKDNIYAVQSVNVISNITKDHDDKIINLGITNNTNKKFVLRYFTYKEEY